jgi:hypothetical protein
MKVLNNRTNILPVNSDVLWQVALASPDNDTTKRQLG